MKHDDPKMIDALAAEYVLGTLSGRARRRFERWRSKEWHVERRVQAWEERLSGLALRLSPMRPSPTSGVRSRSASAHAAGSGHGHAPAAACGSLAGHRGERRPASRFWLAASSMYRSMHRARAAAAGHASLLQNATAACVGLER